MGRATEIRNAINASCLRECVVLNPFPGINQKKDARLATWGAFSHKKNKSFSVGSDKVSNKSLYRMTGHSLNRDLSSGPWAGNCQTFACTTAVLLASINRITNIELFSFGPSFAGHVFLVIDRDQTGGFADLAHWGARAIVVDVWYSNQREEDRDGGVFKIANASEYKTWLALQRPFKRLLVVK